MRAPIARRSVTGARTAAGLDPGARPRPVPLRRPLALLYRRSSEPPPAPAAVRSADGRAVPLAPRLQVAIHLWLTLAEHHHASPPTAAVGDRADAPKRAAAVRPSILVSRRPVEAGRGAPPQARLRQKGPSASAAPAAPPAAWAGQGDVRTGDSRAFASSAFSTFPAGRTGAREAAADLPSPARPTPAARLRQRQRPIRGSAGDPPRRVASPQIGAKAPPAGRPESRADLASVLAPAEAERRLGGSAPRALGAAAAAAAAARPVQPRPAPAPGRAAASLTSVRAARAAPPPLYLSSPEARPKAAASAFASAWAPPPLDYRAKAPASPAPPRSETRAAPAAMSSPAAPELDLEAVSRDVVRRIEKRLRIERERRGRS